MTPEGLNGATPHMSDDVAARFAEWDEAEVDRVLVGDHHHDPDGDATTKPPASPWTDRVVSAPPSWQSETPPPRDFLLRDRRTSKNEGVLPKGIVALMPMLGGGGKTQAVVQLAIASVTGLPWLGAWTPTKPCRVLAAFGEESEDELRRRFWRGARSMKAPTWPEGSIDVMPLAGVSCELLSVPSPHAEPVPTEFATWLRDRVLRERYDVVILDPVARFACREVETHNHVATRFVSFLETLTTDGAVVFSPHHTSQWARARGLEADTTHARGVTGLTDAARWVLTMTVERFDEADEALREVVVATVTKSNHARRPAPIVLRRDLDHGGALVPCDDADLEMVERLRAGTEKRADKRREREAERVDGRRQRDADDDAAVRELLTGDPTIKQRDLRVEVMRRRSCGKERACDAIARVRRERERPHA